MSPQNYSPIENTFRQYQWPTQGSQEDSRRVKKKKMLTLTLRGVRDRMYPFAWRKRNGTKRNGWKCTFASAGATDELVTMANPHLQSSAVAITKMLARFNNF